MRTSIERKSTSEYLCFVTIDGMDEIDGLMDGLIDGLID
jgi:hypothetical protein